MRFHLGDKRLKRIVEMCAKENYINEQVNLNMRCVHVPISV